MPEDTHIPEFAVMAVGAHVTRARPAPAAQWVEERDSIAPTRPIRLFARPEPIDAMAEVPDGPPAQFTWRRVRHVVAHVEGPERIATQWWRDADDDALMRDYFRVETREGVRVWLFRRWPNDPRDPIRWFLHGVFA
jgi:protein ImuB